MSEIFGVKTAMDKALQQASRCAQSETSDNYVALEDELEELEGQARETFQSKMAFASLLPKLEKQKPLTPSDLKTLEMLVVGDAEYYLRYETKLDVWRSEFSQILKEITALQSADLDLDVDGLMHLRALCREARRVLPDLVFYFDQKERAGKFQQATKGPIDAEAYRVLTEIVKDMLESEKW
jgi:hypothetical protein